DLDGEVGHRKAGDREGDAQIVLAGLLDVVGRIAIGCCFADAVERTLEMIEAQQQWRVEERKTRHRTSSGERVQRAPSGHPSSWRSARHRPSPMWGVEAPPSRAGERPENSPKMRGFTVPCR